MFTSLSLDQILGLKHHLEWYHIPMIQLLSGDFLILLPYNKPQYQ